MILARYLVSTCVTLSVTVFAQSYIALPGYTGGHAFHALSGAGRPVVDADARWIDGTRYQQSASGLALASKDLLAGGGGTIVIPSGTTIEISKGPVQIGSVGNPVKPIAVILQPGAKIVCNFNDANADCLQLGDSTQLDCMTSALGTAAVQVGPGANVSTLIAPMDRNGLQESYSITNCSFNGHTARSNVATAIIDLTSMADNTYIARNTVYKYDSTTNAPAFLIAPGNTRGGGPMVIEQNWVDAGLSATCFEFNDGNGTNYIGPLYFRANECQNSGTASSLTFSTVAPGHLRNISVDGFLSSMSSAQKIIDVAGCYHCIFRNLQLLTDAMSGVTGIYFENSPGMNGGNVVQNLAIAGRGFAQAIFDAGNNYSSGTNNVNSTSSSYYQVNANVLNNQDFTTLRFVEGPSPTKSHGQFIESGLEACYADSQLHSIACSYNNGNAHPLRPIELGSCAMARGTCTFTWRIPFVSSPVCMSTWTGSGQLTGIVRTNATALGCTVTSTNGSDSALMQIVGIAAPN